MELLLSSLMKLINVLNNGHTVLDEGQGCVRADHGRWIVKRETCRVE